jgi:hypothetical protein
VARFDYVEIYPPTGHPDQVWHGREGHPILDAFLRSARGVTELYSEALPALGVEGPRSTLRISAAHGHPSELREVVISVHASTPSGFPGEMGYAALPDTVGTLDATGRAGLALDTVEGVVHLLARARGWDPEQFDACRRHVVDHDYVYRWDSPWKAAPDRRHQARVRFVLTPHDGFGRARLEVRRRGDDSPGDSSPPSVAFCTSNGFRRAARTLAWSDSETVSLMPYAGFGPPNGLLLASRADGAWTFAQRDDVSVRQPGGEGVRPSPDGIEHHRPRVVAR